METQQMLELLLATVNASMKEHNQDILARIEADRKSDRQQMLAEISANTNAIKSGQAGMRSAIGAMEEMTDASIAEMKADRKVYQEKMMAERKADQEKWQTERKAHKNEPQKMMKEMMDAKQTKTDDNQEGMEVDLKETKEEIKSGEAEMKSTVNAFQERMDTSIANRKDGRKGRTSCQEATKADTQKTEPGPRMMQSVEEHQEIPKEDAAVMPVRGLTKRRRDRYLAASRRQKQKGRIQASGESRRRLTVADKKMTRRATVAWRKKNIFRKIEIQGICGLRKRLTAAGIKMTRHARVAWRR
jgi:hypothetical protein